MVLRANVSLSKKLSKDDNSTGFSVTLEGEIAASVSDAESVVEQVKELFDLAEEALDQQIERSQSTSAIASHDAEANLPARTNGNGYHATPENGRGHQSAGDNGNGRKSEPATNKQVQYLLSIGRRMKLSTMELEREIEQALGQPVGLYDLTKQQAAVVIDQMAGSRQGRN